MFDEMIERIQRTTISVLLKVKVEMRPAPAPVQQSAPVATAQRRPFRRQQPVPMTNMSSYKEAMAKSQQAENADK